MDRKKQEEDCQILIDKFYEVFMGLRKQETNVIIEALGVLVPSYAKFMQDLLDSLQSERNNNQRLIDFIGTEFNIDVRHIKTK